MTFNVNEFKSKINTYGGLAKTSKFVVSINPTNWYSGTETEVQTDGTAEASIPDGSSADKLLAEPSMLRFLCDTTVLPGKQLATSDIRPEGFGLISKIPYDIQHDPLSCTFMMDSEHRVLRFFQMWMQEIVNTGSMARGPNATYYDRTSYEMNYKKNYSTTITISFFDDTETNMIDFMFYDAFPVQLGSVQLGWEQNDTLAKLPVEFTYSSYSVFHETLPTKTFEGRGNNLLQKIASLATIAGAINNLKKPSNIQDLINQVTNVKTIFNNL